MEYFFAQLAKKSAYWMGHYIAFVLALVLCLSWGIAGPIFAYSNTWQLWANTTTTIITFLMVFLIQHAQNVDNKALHLKLDELITTLDAPKNIVAGAEKLPPQELRELAEKESEATNNSPSAS